MDLDPLDTLIPNIEALNLVLSRTQMTSSMTFDCDLPNLEIFLPPFLFDIQYVKSTK